ncbi:MAG TPA: Hsp20/alpha crystallin family protein [Candidatus Competibacteraceae bacterium]|nr:Hsp20/alpha crystallin family protein [Candidatus Competibacteraceae bacterium]
MSKAVEPMATKPQAAPSPTSEKSAPTISSPVPLPSPFEEFERFFEAFFPFNQWRSLFLSWPPLGGLMVPTSHEGWVPRVDVIDRAGEIVVRAELPGVDKKDIEVSLVDNTLTITGTSRHEEAEEKGDYRRREMCYGAFARTLTLPAAVDAEKIKATFRDGVLELVAPKLEQTRWRGPITVE